MRKVRVAINGFGRIGKSFFKQAFEEPNIEVVAINDSGGAVPARYLLKYGSVYGVWPHEVVAKDEKTLVVDGHEFPFFADRDPLNLPWGEHDVDVVVESTGHFTQYDLAKKHLDAGAKRVVISAPVKGDPVPGIESATVLMGINEDKLKTCQITSNGSCTTNASSPVVQIMKETVGVEKAMLNTTHGYTSTQSLVDAKHPKDPRRGRAAAVNIIPTTTGAAVSVAMAIEGLAGKFDGIACRVPVVSGSIADITFVSRDSTSVEEINDIFRKAATEDRWQGIMKVTDDPIVSTDILQERYAAIVDLQMTRVVGGNLVKVMSWYDNEMGYTVTLVKHVVSLGQHV